MGSVPFQIIIPGSLNNNTLEFLFWDDIWSQPCFVQCVKDMMRIWYDMMKIFTSTMLDTTDNWPSWLALKQTESLRWKIPWKIHENHGKRSFNDLESRNGEICSIFPGDSKQHTLGLADPCSFFRRKLILLLESSQLFPVGKILSQNPIKPCTSRQNSVCFFNQDVVPTHP